MKQITEDYVSFETAQLLKEKGFNELCFALYNPEEELIQCGVKLSNTQVERVPGSYSAPTHQMALKWLREVHKIFVEPFVAIDLNGKYHYSFRLLNSICKDILEPKDLRNDFKDTYEQTIEAALLYVLKNLI